MNRCTHCMLIALTVALGGCAGVGTFQSSMGDRVDRLVEQQSYNDALRLLAYVDESHPEYAVLEARRKQIEQKAVAHASSVARKANQLADQGHWDKAFEAYRQAVRQLPADSPLHDSLESLRARQAEQVGALETQQLILEAEWLAEALPLQTALTRVAPDDTRREQELVRLTRAANRASERLTEKGLEALEAGNRTLAQQTLRLASRLSASPEAEEALRQISAEQRARAARKEPAQEAKRQYKRKKEIESLEAALKENELLRARTHAETLSALATEEPRFQALQNELEERVSESISRALATGNSLYSRGHYQEAITHWEKVLALDPGHEQARSRVERAQRVLSTLQRLRERQGLDPKDSN